MRISDWSSDVCSSDLVGPGSRARPPAPPRLQLRGRHGLAARARGAGRGIGDLQRLVHRRAGARRSEEHTSELQSLMRISYAVFCLKKKSITRKNVNSHTVIDVIITNIIATNKRQKTKERRD